MTPPVFAHAWRSCTFLAALALLSCAHGPPTSGPVRSYRLLGAVLEKETARFTQKQQDVEVDSPEHDRTPRVVAVGQSSQVSLNGAHALLAGDDRGTQGWSVDNFVLLEVFTASGQLYARGVVGYVEGVLMGKQRLDNLGRMSFTFDAGEVDITSRVPESEPFTVRATALDYYGVGKVSDLYLVLAYPRRVSGGDDLRGP